MADAHGSGPCEVTLMRVQVPFSAVEKKMQKLGLLHLFSAFFYLIHQKKHPKVPFDIICSEYFLTYDISENTI